MKEIELHEIENNVESQKHLHDNHKKFSKQCAKVLELLRQGNRLTSKSAMVNHGVGHLARRLKDLRDMHGIHIDEAWELDGDGKTTRNKVWFINFKTDRETKKGLTEWWGNYLAKNPGTKLIQSDLFK